VVPVLLTVGFVTMYLNDIQRSGFYAAIGLDAREYDIYVIKKTNETAARCSQYGWRIRSLGWVCIRIMKKLSAIPTPTLPNSILQKLPFTSNGWQFLQL